MGIDNRPETMTGFIRTAAGILALFWMCVIFAFSAQEQEESSAVSETFSYRMVRSADSLFGFDWDDEKLHAIAGAIEGYVRKAAHMTEYAVLSVLLYIWLGKRRFTTGKKMLLAIIITAFYAVSDEIHQLFVAGRSGRFTDVLIDSAGAVLGVLLFTGVKKCISFLWNRRRYRGTESS
ncbi:MAG: VanZ family protein [Blautia sp.]|nr:VanZ family protein [Blautia sp.]MCM1201304.1 VanZ family protein [Bacteroides fragilis]